MGAGVDGAGGAEGAAFGSLGNAVTAAAGRGLAAGLAERCNGEPAAAPERRSEPWNALLLVPPERTGMEVNAVPWEFPEVLKTATV